MALTYECPKDFEIECVREQSLKASDVKKDDIELWLIKSPADFDICRLSGHKMKSKFSVHCEENDNIKYVVKSNTNTAELNSYQCLFPHDTKGTFTLGPSLQGQLDITKVHKMPTSNDAQFPCKLPPHFPSGLKQRYVPFGSSSPKQSPRKRRATKTDDEKSESEINSFETESAKKKKKKKDKKSKRESILSDVLDETADSVMMSTQEILSVEVETPVGNKRKHKKKKKKREEEEEEEEQYESVPLVDVSEIPSEMIVKYHCPGGDSEQDFQKVSKHHKKKKRKHKESSTGEMIVKYHCPGGDSEQDFQKVSKHHKKKKRKHKESSTDSTQFT